MFSSTTRRAIAGAAALTGALTLGPGTATASPAHDDTMAAVLHCTGPVSFTVNVATGAVAGGGNLRCAAAGAPFITGATLTVLAGAAAGTGGFVRTTTTDRLLYNTGEQTQANAVRDFVSLGAGTFESGQGRAVAGRFTPSRLEDAGTGSHVQTGALRTFTLSRYTLTLNVP
ncbi:hypothetical protein ACSNOH_13640 [Streptomyces sp. URMC 127]|uniref:hypothetical protein n=1 Tax=Streptomyces sp. URMC 127 TaxID=3423402 RepID=UPI003F1E3637